MRQDGLFQNVFSGSTRSLDRIPELPASRQGKVYLDLPHRYFASLPDLHAYLAAARDMGANVALLLPHFTPSFSEYVVADYEQPAPLWGTWDRFAETMAFIEGLGMDRMIDVPLNHADWQATHLDRSWYQEPDTGGVEAGADDFDADWNRVRINWGAYVLDNANRDLTRYWLDRVLLPHVERLGVNAVRIDAAWALDEAGLTTLLQETRARAPRTWFVAENLGMAPLLELARAGLAAGSDRFFNNFYWHEGGHYVPRDMETLRRGTGGLPTCTLWSSHDVLMPAMRALGRLQPDIFQYMNDRGIHREICERWGVTSLAQVSERERVQVLRLMRLGYLLTAFVSSDVMWVAGSERALLQRVDVCRTGPADFALGVEDGFAAFLGRINAWRRRLALANTEGLVVPLGSWGRGATGVRGFLRRSEEGLLLVLANEDLDRPVAVDLPATVRRAPTAWCLADDGLATGTGTDLPSTLTLAPGEALVVGTGDAA